MRHSGSQRLGNHTKHNSVNEVYPNAFNERRPFNRTFPNSKDDKHLNTKIKRSCLPSDDLNNCSIIECQPDDWSSTFKNKKIQSDVEKQNDVDNLCGQNFLVFAASTADKPGILQVIDEVCNLTL